MTEQQWQDVERSVMDFFPTRLLVDGYELTLHLGRDKMRLAIAVYVNGVIDHSQIGRAHV